MASCQGVRRALAVLARDRRAREPEFSSSLDNRVSTPHIGICVATTPCKKCRVSRIVESDDPTWAMCIRALSLSVSEWWHRTANAVGSRSARSSRFDSCVAETLSAEVR